MLVPYMMTSEGCQPSRRCDCDKLEVWIQKRLHKWKSHCSVWE